MASTIKVYFGLYAIRIDTGRDNIVMQRIHSRAGYTCRGLHIFSRGSRRAYEKPLTRPTCNLEIESCNTLTAWSI